MLETIFENKQMPVWEEFAAFQNGNVKSESGDLFVEYKYSNFILKVKNYIHSEGGYGYSFMVGMVEFKNPTQLEFQITIENWFTGLIRIFKREKIKISNTEFDKRFFIRSNKAFKTINVLKDKSLSEKIISFNPVRIEITNTGDFGEIPSKGKYMLYCAKKERFKDLTQLNEIHSLLVAFIENLKENCQIQ